MAASPANRPRLAAGLIAAAGLAAAAAFAGDAIRRDLPINLDAQRSEVDFRTNNVVFHNVVISQEDITVRADRAEATGVDFENSQWTFKGKVDIRMEQRGNLQANEAIVVFRDNRITQATIKGSPATFEQRLADADRTARGRAQSIEYAVDTGTVRLAGEAWLTDGRQEISSPLIVYNINEERVQAITSAGGDERVRIKILPQPRAQRGGEP